MKELLENIIVRKQNTIQIDDVYFDPYLVEEESHDARAIFITHSHYDHFSKEDIAKVKNEDTILIIPKDCLVGALDQFDKNHILIAEPNKDYVVGDLRFHTVPMYNLNKGYHPKENNWIGYLLDYNDTTYYIVGDSDATPELVSTKCDVLFIPIGGTYTMDVEEAISATKLINPKVVVPTHYETVVGTVEDAYQFQKELEGIVLCKVYER